MTLSKEVRNLGPHLPAYRALLGKQQSPASPALFISWPPCQQEQKTENLFQKTEISQFTLLLMS